jgi:hypothetical protein
VLSFATYVLGWIIGAFLVFIKARQGSVIFSGQYGSGSSLELTSRLRERVIDGSWLIWIIQLLERLGEFEREIFESDQ